MCACDQEFGEMFLPHQLERGRDGKSGLNVPVTLGFQPSVCRECRALPAEATPVAPHRGRTSKIFRYYWREIYFETTKRFARWAAEQGVTDRDRARHEHRDRHEEIERGVVDEIKALHARAPKYIYSEESAADVLARCNVTIVDIEATYVDGPGGERRIVTGHGSFSGPERAAAAHFEAQGFTTLFCESRPFHALFAIYMWLLIQDPEDPLRDIRGFGDRDAYDAGLPNKMIWTVLPKDFGSPAYSTRRAAAIVEHMQHMEEDLLWIFDYWLGPSHDFRQYLWAHPEDAVSRARQLVEILPPAAVMRILRYLVDSYWQRYLGWPDLLIYNDTSYFFAEVKGSGDKLREDQKQWVINNTSVLHLPFRLIKVHRTASSTAVQ